MINSYSSDWKNFSASPQKIDVILECFYSSCRFWILQGIPTSHSEYLDNIAFEDLDEWNQKMGDEDLEKDFEKSQYKLFNYFQQMGF